MTVTRSTGTGLPTRVAAVLVDLDNTLVASEDAWFAAARDLWTEAAELGHINIADLTDPRITAWFPEVIA